MKHFVKSTIVLTLFAFSVLLFNLSCEKDVTAQTSNPVTTSPLGLILFTKSGDKPNEVWFCKYDGTNATKVTIAGFPSGADLDKSTMKISPDGKKIFFCMYIISTNLQSIYSCNADGSGLTKVVENVDEIAQVF